MTPPRPPKRQADMAPACPYCDKRARLASGADIYPHRPDIFGLHAKPFWQCVPCGAYVGCHPGTRKPLGRLANAALRLAKMRAHEAFDPLWKSGRMGRNEAYGWLTRALGIPGSECHIGMFDEAQCAAVVRAVQEQAHV